MPVTRKAVLTDLPRIKAIDELLFQDDSYPMFVLRQLLDITSGLIKVAEVDNELVGYMIAHYNAEKQEGWLLSLGVLPGHRGKKIGEKLMAAGIAQIEAKGAEALYLTVHPDNTPGLRIYERLGFHRLEQLEDYYLDKSPRILMGKYTHPNKV